MPRIPLRTAERLSDLAEPLHTNRLWHACPLDPSCWWTAWAFAAPLRIYGPSRQRWVTVLPNRRRRERMYADAVIIDGPGRRPPPPDEAAGEATSAGA